MEQHPVVRRAQDGGRAANLIAQCSGVRRALRSDQNDVHHQNPDEAGTIARTLRIDYVYVDDVERRAYKDGICFDASPAFEKVFEEGPVALYRVR